MHPLHARCFMLGHWSGRRIIMMIRATLSDQLRSSSPVAMYAVATISVEE